MEKKINSYSSPFNLGHKALEDLFTGNVVVQEKVDGSQISFGLIDGELSVRSRRKEVNQEKPEMFEKAVTYLKTVTDEMIPDWIYRGEFLMKPRHNTLSYTNTPKNNIILYDIDKGNQDYVERGAMQTHAFALDLTCVPTLATYSTKPTLEELQKLLETKSVLGGVKIEGIVIKNYGRFDWAGKKTLMGKLVSDAFREVHTKDWKKRNPQKNDFYIELVKEYATEQRWNKALQHLKEEGKLEHSMRDIPLFMREVSEDILAECKEEMMEKLFKHFWKKCAKGMTRGLPEWYKGLLTQSMFEASDG